MTVPSILSLARPLVSCALAAVLAGAAHAQARYFVETIGVPTTTIYAAPSLDAQLLGVYPDPLILESLTNCTGNDGQQWDTVAPLPGSGLGWTEGYVLSDQIRVTVNERPISVGLGVYGSYGSADVGSHSFGGITNPLGTPGTANVFGVGLSSEVGRYIPAGGIGPLGRVLVDYNYLAVGDAPSGLSRSESSLTRLGLGGDLVYRISSGLDLSVGAVATAGLLRQDFAEGRDTVRFDARVIGADVTAGLGLGRAAAQGLRLRLEGGYRFATRLGDWDASLVGSGQSETVTFDGAEPLSLSGPIARVVIGISFGGRKTPTTPGVTTAPPLSAAGTAPPLCEGTAAVDPDPVEVDTSEPEPVVPDPVEPAVIPPPGPERTRWVQATLERIGYACGGVDGRMGTNTRSCLRAYQTDLGLPVTGEPDEATLDALAYEQ